MSSDCGKVDPKELGSYVATITDFEIIEDLSHLLELKVVTGAIASTEFGNLHKLPLESLSNILTALAVYRDELANRAFSEDREEDSGFTMLGEYYKCVKAVRSMAKYLDKVVPVVQVDYTDMYANLARHKSALQFNQESAGV